MQENYLSISEWLEKYPGHTAEQVRNYAKWGWLDAEKRGGKWQVADMLPRFPGGPVGSCERCGTVQKLERNYNAVRHELADMTANAGELLQGYQVVRAELAEFAQALTDQANAMDIMEEALKAALNQVARLKAEIAEKDTEIDNLAREKYSQARRIETAGLQVGKTQTDTIRQLSAYQQTIASMQRRLDQATQAQVTITIEPDLDAFWRAFHASAPKNLLPNPAEKQAERLRDRLLFWRWGRNGNGGQEQEAKKPLPLPVLQSAFRHDAKLRGDNSAVKQVRNVRF